MNPITLLVELQNLDIRIDENAAHRAALETQLADSGGIAAAQAALDASTGRAAGLKRQLGALELETQGLADKLKELNERLYSGRVTNPKELAGLNQDEKSLQRRKRELEDQELALMEESEVAERQVLAGRDALEALSTRKADQHARDRAAFYDLQTAASALSQKREELRARLAPALLQTYDELRRTKRGRAVAALKGNSCAACGYAVPSGVLSRVKLGQEPVFCPNCGRILAG